MRIDIANLEFIDEKLREILVWLEDSTGLEFTTTSQYRIGDKGVHGTLPLRGIDLRMRNYTVGYAIALVINNNWQYDPQRKGKPCALLHGCFDNQHLHLQVHPNTVRLDN